MHPSQSLFRTRYRGRITSVAVSVAIVFPVAVSTRSTSRVDGSITIIVSPSTTGVELAQGCAIGLLIRAMLGSGGGVKRFTQATRPLVASSAHITPSESVRYTIPRSTIAASVARELC